MRITCVLVLLLCCCFDQSYAQQKRPTTYWPEDTTYEDSITTPKEFFGFEVGQRHLDHAQLVAYLKQISSETPRFSYSEYGKTHGGRPLLLLTISNPANLQRIDRIRQQHRQLANPDLSDKVKLVGLPAVINMGYGVHGDEASASNCSAVVAYYLAAAQGVEIESWLKDCVILLDPCLNPDGFNRFANWVNGYRGRIPNADPQHREHNQGWPSGRVNYYWFDLNRDWLPLEHPESRSRMRWYHAWKPNVVLDYHEMGTNSSYFFQPGVPNRTNPLTPAKNVELTNRIGAYYAKALDRRVSVYYTREGFDDFYMGKGSTYPDLHGAVGILFEQASARGHVQKNQDGMLTFHSAIANHFTTSLSSLKATSEMREELLNYKRDFYVESLAIAKKQKKKAVVFESPGNATRLQNFANVLLRHDIKCYWPITGTEKEANREKLVVPLQQPEFRFLRSLLSRKKNFKENIFYDVSTWTLPLAYNLKSSTTSEESDLEQMLPAKIGSIKGKKQSLDQNSIAYIVPYQDDKAVWLLNQLLENDVNVKVSLKPFSSAVNELESLKEFDRGTLLIALGIQKQKRKIIESLLKKMMKHGIDVYSANSGLTPEGSDFGSSRFKTIPKPSIALVVGRGVAQYEAGEIWHLLDVKTSMPVSLVELSSLGTTDLSRYETIIFPSGTYKRVKESDWAAITERIKNGATVISIGSSCARVFDQLNAGVSREPKAENERKQSKETQLPFDSASKTQALKRISGSIFRVKIDPTHPIFFGYATNYLPVFRNHTSFLKPSENPYGNPAIYDPDKPHMSGYCSDENVEKFKTAASVVVRPIGKGRVIQFSDNPNFRAFWHGTSRMFINSIYFGKFTSPR